MTDRATPTLRLLHGADTTAAAPDGAAGGTADSYVRLADLFHEVLSEHSLDALLERIADALADLVPHDTLTIFEADDEQRLLLPMLARDQWAEEIMKIRQPFGTGITGWAVEHGEAVLANQAHLDPRVVVVPGTPENEPEAMMSIPLIARGSVLGALNVYRLGDNARFDDAEFELARRFSDAAALAIDNAKIRDRLEHQAQTDSLTGLYNHRYFHERLRRELVEASRARRTVALLMLDIDDFKRVNDIYGHAAGDEVLRSLADTMRRAVRSTDVVCRLGGEEFGVIMTSCDEGSALVLARRMQDLVREVDLEPAGRISLSVGLAQGPQHAMNPRELVACAEAAMMTAKARGKDRIVLYGEGTSERPEVDASSARDVRSIAHLKMLQSLSGKLNRLVDVREIGNVIANELRSLIDYHNCRVFVIDGDDVVPIAFRGVFTNDRQEHTEILACKVGEGITGHVAESGESLLLPDAAASEYALPVPGTALVEESMVAVPLAYGSRVIGVIVITKLGLDQFDDDDVRLMEVLAGQASVAVENARLYESARREAESATALLEFSRQLATAEGIEAILDRIVELSASILGAPRTSVWLQDQDTGELGARASFGVSDERRDTLLAVRFPTEIWKRLRENPEPFVLSARDLERGGIPSHPSDSWAIAPLTADGGRFGCIVAASENGRGAFSERDLSLLGGIAHQAKLAITNAGNFESLEGTFLSTVEALANALEANDEYTSSHARWITDMALRVGEELGLEGRALKRLELGALFHDIGKIGIPSTILLKPGPLTDEERRVIEQHPELGERILAPIERLQDVCPIVRHCHERYDGAGYPDRRSGDEIPLESRIILVCDAYHAMTTDRPYRKRLAPEEACRRLEKGAGTQFDPGVVATFISLWRAGAVAHLAA